MLKVAADPIVGASELFRRFRSALEWRVYRPLHMRYAQAYRARLDGVTFIGVTGSAGKTSTKSMITAILESAGCVRHSLGTANRLYHIAEVVAATKPGDDYCVLELSAERPGYFNALLDLVRPAIGVVTTVGEDQLKAFGSQEAIAAEKGKLIAALPEEGTAVLNADDPLVWAMRERCKGRVVSYGLSDGVDLQAHDIRSDWPERLSFTIRHRGQDYPVQTQFCGKHWVTSTLAALATGTAAGIPLAEAAKVVAQIAPLRARMEPVTTPDGITFVRDDWKGAFWGLPAVFDFLRDAKADRKIIVLGTLSDYQGTARNKYQFAGQEALKAADVVIFVGKMATLGLRAEKFAADGQVVMAFPDVREASAALQKVLRHGDLVVLRGSGVSDHLGRLYHAWAGPVACWRKDCGKDMLCDGCPELRSVGAKVGVSAISAKPSGRTDRVSTGVVGAEDSLQVFVGIGNPGDRYRDTPHNIGFSVLDLLAERHGLTWETREGAQIARLVRPKGVILLVKPQKHVNNTGKALQALSQSMGFAGDRCLLVHDDIHLPVGKVRTRLRGSDGGHLGVRSVLSAFQTGNIARVKVGVGSATNGLRSEKYLVSPFPPDVAEKVRAACVTAADRLLQVAEQQKADG